ncbi:MAG: hypothetical protein J0H71_19630 [Rhizobiales bacterium]|nr:hypothetical protein [Hyphomicrobiales bacterium]
MDLSILSIGIRGDTSISTQILPAGAPAASRWAMSGFLAVATVAVLLIAPAIWNGYPLLQYDTGGYLARWYEGYLVPSRSTVYGLYLHFGESSYFWLNLAFQSVVTLWVLHLTLRVLGLARPLRLAGITLILILTTALPWLASMLITDIFAGLAVLTLFLLAAHGDRLSRAEKIALFAFTAFAAATHSATFGVLFGLCVAGWVLLPWLRPRLTMGGLTQGTVAVAVSAILLVAANYALSGQLAWTPGGPGVTFGRMMQDGIVARYLNDHCDTIKLKLCPYRNQLPATADEFLWANDSIFNKLGRFEGMDDEMGFIAAKSLTAYPLWQIEAALMATATQLHMVGTGEGTNGWIPHTYGIIERYLPTQTAAMRAAHQQHWDINFTSINWIHVPVALLAMLLLVALLGRALWRRRLDNLGLLAATVALALLGNAFLCGVISGPHDRYGARMVWIAVLVVLIAAELFRSKRPHPTDQDHIANP